MGPAVRGQSTLSDRAVGGRSDAGPPVSWSAMGFSTAPLRLPVDNTATPPTEDRPPKADLWTKWSPHGDSSGSK
eukprot:15120639-Heterocapsa_arctica.AAC.1